MAVPRLTFLYPQLCRAQNIYESRSVLRSLQECKANVHGRNISSSRRRRQETYAQRYGTAKEPHIASISKDKVGKSEKTLQSNESKTLAGVIEKEVKAPAKEGLSDAASGTKAVEAVKAAKGSGHIEKKAKLEKEKNLAEGQEALTDRSKAIEIALRDPGQRAKELGNVARASDKSATDVRKESETSAGNAIASVMQMPAPAEYKLEEHKPPHMTAPPYVHHFDSFTLVKDLERGGFTSDQSVTVMKAVRVLLATNMDVAREGLISKSDVENETYLFRAACSELRTEILNLRRSTSAKQNTQLSHLQYTHDILSQRTTAELASLRDELKGMLNDRRMATRASSMVLDSDISELNYKISVALNSDAKSEVEGLRWVLTRRAAMAIVVMAILILGSLRWGSYKLREAEIEAKRLADKDRAAHMGGPGASSMGERFTTSAREMGTQTDGPGGTSSASNGTDEVDKAENVGYVSLG